MSIEQTDGAPAARPRRTALIVAIVAAVALVCAVVASVGWTAFSRSRLSPEQSFDREMLGHPQMGSLFVAFRDTYPADYTRFKTVAIARVQAGDRGLVLRRFGSDWMRDFMRTHIPAIAQAPHAHLVAVRNGQLAVARALQRSSVEQCGHFIMAGLRPTDQIADDVLPLIARQGTAQLQAAAAGERAPVGRAVADLSRRDATAWAAAMREVGMSEADLLLIDSPMGLQTAGEARQCELGLKMLEGIAALPAEQADRVTGFLLTHS